MAATGATGISPSTTRGEETTAIDLETISGRLGKSDTDYVLEDGTTVDFGPTWYLSEAETDADYDGDGDASGTLAEEFDGLVGTEVELGVDSSGRSDDRDGYIVNGKTYRNPGDDSPPPWASHERTVAGPWYR